ncbi:MAG: RdgB/HAM1 family non-canonical purine NTP pyrophosphatase [Dehalococcoidia bacterium]|jgi:XTP/dITP diphosphohydrolase|nr:RdgB/HAM1 family non-canonical purine NTP pyrophosphatase [Dehalococcoidia bacterium]
MSRPKLLLATNNAGKARELVVLLDGVPFIVTTPQEEGIVLDVEETGTIFEENAALKSRAFASVSGLLSLADDSGLEVDALGGEPGVMSARYAGPEASDEDRVRHLLSKLEGIEWNSRGARFRSVIAISGPAGTVELFEGVCEGVIALSPKGAGGFGYDPVFYVSSLGKLMAELTMEEKNSISHRGSAARKAVEYLKT